MSAARPLVVRLRACALARSRDGERVLLVQEHGDDFWTLPGGSVEPGEFAHEALERELGEELGTRHLSPARLFLVCENHFTWRGQPYQEMVMAFDLDGLNDAIEAHEGPFSGPEPHLTFEWVTWDVARRRDVRPGVLRGHLRPGPRAPGAIAHECLREPSP